MKTLLSRLPIDPDHDPISISQYMGYSLAAPLSFWSSPQEIKDELTGGCGPGGTGDIFVPDTMYLLNMKPACSIHDWCYVVWNTKAGFPLANNLFKNNMLRIDRQHAGYHWISELRKKRIKFYYDAVEFGGGPHYFDAHLKYI